MLYKIAHPKKTTQIIQSGVPHKRVLQALSILDLRNCGSTDCFAYFARRSADDKRRICVGAEERTCQPIARQDVYFPGRCSAVGTKACDRSASCARSLDARALRFHFARKPALSLSESGPRNEHPRAPLSGDLNCLPSSVRISHSENSKINAVGTTKLSVS